MNALTEKNQLIDEEKKLKRLISRLVEMIILTKSIPMEILSIIERNTGQAKYVRKCFVQLKRSLETELPKEPKFRKNG